MGILNVTPDSFSDGGVFLNPENAIAAAKQMVTDGADMVDIGAESSAPGSVAVDAQEEWNRLEPVLEAVVALKKPVSVDTWKAEIAEKSLNLGVQIINDITALRGDSRMANVVKGADCEMVIMYSKDDTARTTRKHEQYKEPIREIGDFLAERIEFAAANGIDPQRLILDPGMGAFVSADPAVSFLVIKHLSELKRRFPENKILIGTSRKGFLKTCSIHQSTEESKRAKPTQAKHSRASLPRQRLISSVVSAVLAVGQGVDIVRVHDVRETREGLSTFLAVRDAG